MSDAQPAGIVSVLIHPYAREGQVEAAVRELAKIVEPARANPECIAFHALQDNDDPRKFTLFEQWTSLDAVMEHGKRDYMAAKDEIFESLDGDFITEI